MWLGSIGVRRRGDRQRVSALLARQPGSGRDVNTLAIASEVAAWHSWHGHTRLATAPRSVLTEVGCCLGGIYDHQRLALASTS